MKKVLIYGSGEFGCLLKDLALGLKYTFSGFIDDFREADEVVGAYATVRDRFSPDEYEIVIGIGYKNMAQRMKIFESVLKDGYQVPSLIHEGAGIGHVREMGAGVIVMRGAIVEYNARVGDISVVWPGAVINHDCVVGANTFISPNATICGFAQVGDSCFIGAGTVVADHVIVPSGTLIKAGRVYSRNSYADPSVTMSQMP